MKNKIKSLVISILQKCGYKLSRLRKFERDISALKSLLNSKAGKLIFDVGAHHGETAKLFNANFENLEIFCFEPFTESYNILNLNVAEFTNIKTFNIGLSDFNGPFDFNSNYRGNSLKSYLEKKEEISSLKNQEGNVYESR